MATGHGDLEIARVVAATTEAPAAASAAKKKNVAKNSAAVKRNIALAIQKASAGSVWPICHGRCCLVFLWVLVAIRLFAWRLGNVPGGTIWFVHVFSLLSDVITSIVTLPLLLCGNSGGVQGQCVQLGCVGPMMTMVVAMNLVDGCSLLAFFVYAAPRPLPSSGRSYVDVMELVHPVWELVLIASCAVNFAICVSCWRIYRELRAAGLYPPGAKGETPRESVSPFEVLCEAEDVALLAECTRTRQDELEQCCNNSARHDSEVQIVADTMASEVVDQQVPSAPPSARSAPA